MNHRDVAELAAVLGAAGALLVLVPRQRSALLAGFGLLAAAEALFAYALVPGSDLHAFVASPLRIAALLVGAGAVVALAAGFVRYAAVVPVALLAAAPFRVPLDIGSQRTFLLLPLYCVLAAAVLALAYRAVRAEGLRPVPLLLGVCTAAFVVIDALSLLWALDRRAGSIELAFFVFPFVGVLAVLARSPFGAWLPRALAATIVGLAGLFAAIGLWQLHSHDLFFAKDVEATNAYSSFYRVTSLFKDPSIYGRNVVFGVAVLVVALWLRRVHAALAAALLAFLWAGLYFSYSQSSMVTLLVVTVAVSLVLADRRGRYLVAGACAAGVLVAAGVVVANDHGHPLRRLTSGRSHLVSVTATVYENHPFAGVGVGSQPAASRREASPGTETKRNASHTTPLTVAAELGTIGLLAYLAFLGSVVYLLLRVRRRDLPIALGLGAVFLAVFVHSLFYSGFFEDPLTWAIPGVAAAFLAAPALAPAGLRLTDARAAATDSTPVVPPSATAPTHRSS